MDGPVGLPELVDPVVIAGFEGWNDAADAASQAVAHLARAWDATPLLAIDPDDYYDFQVNRPTVSITDGRARHIEWPTTRLSVARLGDPRRDVVLVQGIEPNMRWRAFTEEIVAAVAGAGANTVVTLGALLADTPHTRPVPVTATTSDEALAASLDLPPSTYEGPTGIVGVFQEACSTAGLPAVSLWAAVPHYVAQPPCPKATLALLRRVEDLLDLTVPLGDLPEEARAWQRGVDALAAQDTEVSDYVRALEEAKDTVELPEASGESIAREFERYLRRRGHGEAP